MALLARTTLHSRMPVWISVKALLLIPASHSHCAALGDEQLMVQFPGTLLPSWESQAEFLSPDL